MSQPFPYTYISCPCSDVSARRLLRMRRPLSRDLSTKSDYQTQQTEDDSDEDDEEKTFDPHHARSAYSLFPPDHLLYCEECCSIKCPRCVTEEIICTYCPSCLFEVPSSQIKQDLNRCSRNCFCCPICISQLVTTSLGGAGSSSTSNNRDDGPYILSCNYCMWTSADVGITFNKPQNLRSQIERIANGGKPQPDFKDIGKDISKRNLGKALERDINSVRSGSLLATASRGSEENASSNGDNDGRTASDLANNPHARFQALKAFYKDQIAQSGEGPAYSGGIDYSSPSSITRLMNMYTNTGSTVFRKTKTQYTTMREAMTPAEGLLASPLPPLPSNQELRLPSTSEPQTSISKPPPSEPLTEVLDYIDTVSPSQQIFQYPSPLGTPTATNVSHLRPMPTLLRTKRAKRCATCKHILAKPEFKVTSTRYRIKLVALNYIPYVTLRPLNNLFSTVSAISPDQALLQPGIDGSRDLTLQPSKPSQWIMTLRNPLFERVTVSLGCPSVTPGPLGHKVTILCPAFSIGPSGDVWDDALNDTSKSTSMTAKGITPTAGAGVTGEQIAGKPYDSGRNWTSVVIEIVPVAPLPKKVTKHGGQPGSDENDESEGDENEDEERDEDDTVIEIPIRVRLEWTPTVDLDASNGGKTGSGGKAGPDELESPSKKGRAGGVSDGQDDGDSGVRELAYWMVLGIGRVMGSS